ncbi:MAG: HPr kinase/phosphorylase [Lachnospiraceae bacterium]|nr:HPr kinase/phosphorylase [Lachnospiraceae bacterium]
MNGVNLKKVIDYFGLKELTKGIDSEKIKILVPDINRPALQLAGFYEHFDVERIQVIGNVEWAYMQSLVEAERKKRFEKLFLFKIPCLLFSRGYEPDETIVKMAEEAGIPILVSDKITSDLTSEVNRWLKVELAPMISVHGVLVDVYGEGVLIMGESGIGKSEAALELIKRGHRLVSDDVVEIKKVSDATLVGSAPDITRHFIELRGIGIIDVKTLFGVESVKNTQQIDMVIQLEDWNKDTEYDRLGLEDKYIEFLGNKVVCHNIPIRPGRNLAVIVESAAVNYRQKKMGYNAVQELYKRIQENMKKGSEEE